MVNYTNRMMVALENGTLVKLSQRPRDDRETYFDRKSNYSLNVQVVCDENKHVIYLFAGMHGSCYNVIYLRRSSLCRRLNSVQLFDFGQCLLGDSGYVPLERLVCSYKRTGDDMDKVSFNTCIVHARVGNEHCIGILKARWHSVKEIRTQLKNTRENAYVIRWIWCCVILHKYLIWRNDDWSEDDHPIELEREDEFIPPPHGVREQNRRGIQHGQEAEFVKEFVLNWDDNAQRSTMDSEILPMNVDVIRHVFGLAEGRSVPRFTRQYEDLSDWVPERSKTAKTWYANDVFLPEWRPIIQLINVVLLGK
ncbi:hypothetical protein R1sor_024906 [Riccia sorocarpa]|uniref:DDE Tnp4 domain-containing protein n=1 Tax=Riccia sorocarpa TaxID=122646 RepID=A0ABD3GUZ0_9MARC